MIDTQKSFKEYHHVLLQGEHNGNLKTVWTKLLNIHNNICPTTMTGNPIDDFQNGYCVLDLFGSLVCASTIMHEPLLTTKFFALQKTDDLKQSGDTNNPLLKNKDFIKKIGQPSSQDWILSPNPRIKNYNVAKICGFVDRHTVQVMLGVSKYRPKNEKEYQNALKTYQKHFKVDEANYAVADSVSISDVLDNNQDREGLLKGCDAIKYTDNNCYYALRHKKFNYVLNPKALVPSYV